MPNYIKKLDTFKHDSDNILLHWNECNSTTLGNRLNNNIRLAFTSNTYTNPRTYVCSDKILMLLFNTFEENLRLH